MTLWSRIQVIAGARGSTTNGSGGSSQIGPAKRQERQGKMEECRERERETERAKGARENGREKDNGRKESKRMDVFVREQEHKKKLQVRYDSFSCTLLGL